MRTTARVGGALHKNCPQHVTLSEVEGSKTVHITTLTGPNTRTLAGNRLVRLRRITVSSSEDPLKMTFRNYLKI